MSQTEGRDSVTVLGQVKEGNLGRRRETSTMQVRFFKAYRLIDNGHQDESTVDVVCDCMVSNIARYYFSRLSYLQLI